jgi:hypothetical protein
VVVLRVSKEVEASTTVDPPEQVPLDHAVAHPLTVTANPRDVSVVNKELAAALSVIVSLGNVEVDEP